MQNFKGLPSISFQADQKAFENISPSLPARICNFTKNVISLHPSGTPIDKLYAQMGKVDVFVIELNLLLACFGLSALFLLTPDPTYLASLHRRSQSMSLNGHSWFNSQ